MNRYTVPVLLHMDPEYTGNHIRCSKLTHPELVPGCGSRRGIFGCCCCCCCWCCCCCCCCCCCNCCCCCCCWPSIRSTVPADIPRWKARLFGCASGSISWGRPPTTAGDLALAKADNQRFFELPDSCTLLFAGSAGLSLVLSATDDDERTNGGSSVGGGGEGGPSSLSSSDPSSKSSTELSSHDAGAVAPVLSFPCSDRLAGLLDCLPVGAERSVTSSSASFSSSDEEGEEEDNFSSSFLSCKEEKSN
jgi:hypothetical protein